jgi:HSP90 family molecular chaperone
MTPPKYRMTISLHVRDHLGLNLYSSMPAVLSEAVANAWDADAKKVEVTVDRTKQEITIKDNGLGMDEREVNKKYLTVGYQRRARKEDRVTPSGRHVMGRKGIGKLSLFALAPAVGSHALDPCRQGARWGHQGRT